MAAPSHRPPVDMPMLQLVEWDRVDSTLGDHLTGCTSIIDSFHPQRLLLGTSSSLLIELHVPAPFPSLPSIAQQPSPLPATRARTQSLPDDFETNPNLWGSENYYWDMKRTGRILLIALQDSTVRITRLQDVDADDIVVELQRVSVSDAPLRVVVPTLDYVDEATGVPMAFAMWGWSDVLGVFGATGDEAQPYALVGKVLGDGTVENPYGAMVRPAAAPHQVWLVMQSGVSVAVYNCAPALAGATHAAVDVKAHLVEVCSLDVGHSLVTTEWDPDGELAIDASPEEVVVVGGGSTHTLLHVLSLDSLDLVRSVEVADVPYCFTATYVRFLPPAYGRSVLVQYMDKEEFTHVAVVDLDVGCVVARGSLTGVPLEPVEDMTASRLLEAHGIFVDLASTSDSGNTVGVVSSIQLPMLFADKLEAFLQAMHSDGTAAAGFHDASTFDRNLLHVIKGFMTLHSDFQHT